jgi:sodium transport system permease protein
MPDSWDMFRNHTIITLIAFIATPAVMMAILLTRRPDRALLLRRPSFIATIPAAVLLAVLLHPSYVWLGHWISVLYPISEQTAELLQPIAAFMKAAPLWQLVLTIGLTPAICEELAFRGFILSGFRHLGNKWMAIALSALFFGIAHGVLQQSISASAMGLVLGYLAIKTGSLFPVIAYHFAINSLSVITQRLGDAEFKAYPILNVIFQTHSATDGNLYDPFVTVGCLSFAVALLFWFKSLPYESTKEEILHDALERETGQSSLSKSTAHSWA